MRRFFTIILCLMLLPAGSAMAMTATDEKDGKKSEQKDDNKKDDGKKDDNKEENKPRKPILIVVYEFAWPWVTR